MVGQEFEKFKSSLSTEEQDAATGFFTTIRRRSPPRLMNLEVVPYSSEYDSYLKKAADFLHKAGDAADTPR
jgi:hypothetical protein